MQGIAKPLSRQVIVLTGAAGCVGLCTARLAAQRGARLVLMARRATALDDLASLVRSAGGEAMCLAVDVGDRAQMLAAAQSAVHRFGHIDTWINNAGVSIYGRLDEVSEADSRRLFDTNFWGAVNGSLAALPYLQERQGTLINLGSEVPGPISPLQGMYASSKQAVKAFTDALRAELEADAAPVAIEFIEPIEMPGADLQPQVDPQRVAEAILNAACDRVPGPAALRVPPRGFPRRVPAQSRRTPQPSP